MAFQKFIIQRIREKFNRSNVRKKKGISQGKNY